MRRLRTSLLLAVTAILVSASLKPATAAGGFIICSCKLCSESDVVCRISPSGYSIPCADYYQAHCLPTS